MAEINRLHGSIAALERRAAVAADLRYSAFVAAEKSKKEICALREENDALARRCAGLIAEVSITRHMHNPPTATPEAQRKWFSRLISDQGLSPEVEKMLADDFAAMSNETRKYLIRAYRDGVR